jgi:riboflavin biosynthesis pyrimidine reductase
MRLLLPGDSGLPTGSSLDLPALARAYAAPPRPWLRCNMVTTLDGAANGPDAKSGSINTEADHVVFELLRALSHAVVIGAGTGRVEGYPALDVPTEMHDIRHTHGLPRELGLVVVTRSGDVPPTVRECHGRRGGPVLLATTASAPGLADARRTLGDDVLVCGDDEVDLTELVRQLHARGWHQLLTEGGPHLIGSFVAAGLFDELCYTIAPLVVGGIHPRTVGPDAGPTTLDLRLLVEQDGTLMGRWFTGRGVA